MERVKDKLPVYYCALCYYHHNAEWIYFVNNNTLIDQRLTRLLQDTEGRSQQHQKAAKVTFPQISQIKWMKR